MPDYKLSLDPSDNHTFYSYLQLQNLTSGSSDKNFIEYWNKPLTSLGNLDWDFCMMLNDFSLKN